MTAINKKLFFPLFNKTAFFGFLTTAILSPSCSNERKVYISDCDSPIKFKRVGFSQLIDSMAYYDKQYVEVSGKYQEGKEQSALFNDSLFVDHANNHALWVNFSQDCPLYLSGTRIGFFDTNDGQFTQIHNKQVTIRGKVDMHQKGYLGAYKGSIDRVSYIKL